MYLECRALFWRFTDGNSNSLGCYISKQSSTLKTVLRRLNRKEIPDQPCIFRTTVYQHERQIRGKTGKRHSHI